MQQSTHTAINWLNRCQIQEILENYTGTACYDDEPTNDLRECLREQTQDCDHTQSIILGY